MYVEPHPRRVQAIRDGRTVIDTAETMIGFETALEPRLDVHPSLVRTDLLRRADTTSYCNYKGDATYWSAVIGDAIVEDVAWSHEDPLPETLPIKGYLSLDATRADVRAELPVSASSSGLRPPGLRKTANTGPDLM